MYGMSGEAFIKEMTLSWAVKDKVSFDALKKKKKAGEGKRAS